MVRSFTFVAASCLARVALSSAFPRDTTSPGQAKYRTSSIDGTKIALPTKEQLAFQDNEIGMLIHFDTSQYYGGINGCNFVPELVPEAELFNPTELDTDQWMEVSASLGAKFATLVAKHNCGFATWPTETTFQLRNNQTQEYNYTIDESPVRGLDLVGSFKESAAKYDIGRGLYYSANVNNFLNVQLSTVLDTPLSPGQVAITNSTYDEIVFDQLTELWSSYGEMTEIWFDGGYSATQEDKIIELLQEYQPQAMIFNGCQTNGSCVSENSVRWIGNEVGEAPEENWSSGVTNDGGDMQSPIFCPSVCDTTLLTDGLWFYNETIPLRSITELISVYHTTVGRNCVLELNLTPADNGLIAPNHVALYEELGTFISSCYGESADEDAEHDISDDGSVYSISFDSPTSIDRIVLMEDQTEGQVISSYKVEAKVVGGYSAEEWTEVSKGTSIGHKKIDLFDGVVEVSDVRVTTTFIDTPKWRSVSVHRCDELTPGDGTAPA